MTINHFFFVPVTIGLALLTALLQTAWHRSKRDVYLRLTKFFGRLLVINIAIGVVTGIVQEFQFGMNWGAYSRLVGNIFGAPLAMEGLAAFFLESTFLAPGFGAFEMANTATDPEERRTYLTFVLVGAGPTGHRCGSRGRHRRRTGQGRAQQIETPYDVYTHPLGPAQPTVEPQTWRMGR